MSKANSTEQDFLNYVFNGIAIPWNSVTNLFISLHTADPGEAGNQTTNEATYTGYARVAVSRTSGGWVVSSNSGISQVTNTSIIQFAQCTGGNNTITHVGVGTSLTGVGQLLYKGALNSPLAVANLIQPQFTANALTITED